MSGRQPHFHVNLKLKSEERGSGTRIGAAWKNQYKDYDGDDAVNVSMRISLPFTFDPERHELVLWPNKGRSSNGRQPSSRQPAPSQPGYDDDFDDSDIPF